MNDVIKEVYSPMVGYIESRDLKPLFPLPPVRSNPKTFVYLNKHYAEQKLEDFGYSPTHLKKLGPQSFKFSNKSDDFVAKFQHSPDIILQYLLPRIIINDAESSEMMRGKYKFSKYVSNYLTMVLQNDVNEYSLEKPIKDPIDFFEQVFPNTFSNNISVGNLLDIPSAMHQYPDAYESSKMKHFKKGIKIGFLNDAFKAPNGALSRHACIPTLPEETEMGMLVSKYHGSDFGNMIHNSIGDLDTLTKASQSLGKTVAFFNSQKIILGDNLLSNYVWNGKDVVRIDPIHFIEYRNFYDSFLTLREIEVFDKIEDAEKRGKVNIQFVLNQFVSIFCFMQDRIGIALIGDEANSDDASELKFSNILKNMGKNPDTQKDIHFLTTYLGLKFIDAYLTESDESNGYLSDTAAYIGRKTYSKLNDLYKTY